MDGIGRGRRNRPARRAQGNQETPTHPVRTAADEDAGNAAWPPIGRPGPPTFNLVTSSTRAGSPRGCAGRATELGTVTLIDVVYKHVRRRSTRRFQKSRGGARCRREKPLAGGDPAPALGAAAPGRSRILVDGRAKTAAKTPSKAGLRRSSVAWSGPVTAPTARAGRP